MRRKLKICSPQLGLSPTSDLGGEVHDYNVLKCLSKKGHKIFVYLPKGRPHPNEKNIHIETALIKHIPAALFNLIALPYIFRTYWKKEFDVLRLHNPYFLGLGALVFKMFHKNVPIVVTYHLEEDNILFKLINKILIPRVDHIFVVSNYLKNWLIDNFGANAQRISVIYNGVESDLKPMRKKKLLINKYDLKNKFTILSIGLLVKRKNPLFILKVYKMLGSQVALLMCGKGPEKRLLKEYVKKYRLKNVHFVDFVSGYKKRDLFNLSDVFVTASQNEGFGLTIAEALACQKPVLAVNNTSVPELIEDSKNGFLLDYDLNKWQSAINTLWKNKYLREKMGKEGRIKVKEKFSWKKNVNTYEKVLYKVCND